MSADRGRNYFVKFRYDEWLTLTCLLKPIQRDILFTIFCRRATCCKNGIQLNDYELEGIRKHYYRTMRKDAFYRYLKPMIDQGLIIAEEGLGEDVMLYPAKDMVVADRCTNCNKGWIYNTALTKAQESLGDG